MFLNKFKATYFCKDIIVLGKISVRGKIHLGERADIRRVSKKEKNCNLMHIFSFSHVHATDVIMRAGLTEVCNKDSRSSTILFRPVTVINKQQENIDSLI